MGVITATNMTSASIGTVVAGTTASISPVSNSMIIFSVYSNVASGTPNIPTVAGLGLTWTQVSSEAGTGITTSRMTIFKAIGAVTPGAATVSFGTFSQNRLVYSVDQFKNAMDIIQVSMKDYAGTGGSSTGTTVSLNTFSNPTNATFGFLRLASLGAVASGSGFTALSLGTGIAASSWNAQWKDSNDTSVDWTWAGTAVNFMGFAAEIQSTLGGSFIENFV